MEHKIGGRLHNSLRISAESLLDDDTDESPILPSSVFSPFCLLQWDLFD